jgi:hypothetical protein
LGLEIDEFVEACEHFAAVDDVGHVHDPGGGLVGRGVVAGTLTIAHNRVSVNGEAMETRLRRTGQLASCR